MVRKIIEIDQAACNGCGLCADACHEGAIQMTDGKATLVRDDYCDGLGDCLPVCPTGAIQFVQREAAAYDHAAVTASKHAGTENAGSEPLACGCPGTMAKSIDRAPQKTDCCENAAASPSMLSQWPVQIKLVNPGALYLNGADLLVAADCTAFAFGDFHRTFIKNRVALVGCPKLDAVDYAEKLGEILSASDIHSITVARMEVPCCAGISDAVRRAISASGKIIPLTVVTISTSGEIIHQE